MLFRLPKQRSCDFEERKIVFVKTRAWIGDKKEKTN